MGDGSIQKPNTNPMENEPHCCHTGRADANPESGASAYWLMPTLNVAGRLAAYQRVSAVLGVLEGGVDVSECLNVVDAHGRRWLLPAGTGTSWYGNRCSRAEPFGGSS